MSHDLDLKIFPLLEETADKIAILIIVQYYVKPQVALPHTLFSVSSCSFGCSLS